MQPRKFRVLSAVTAGSLAVAAVAITASSGTSPAPRHAALAAQTESFPPVNLDNCPILHPDYPTGGCVAQLQTDLDSLPGYNLTVDGTFGSAGSQTYAAVVAFQQAHGLSQDGLVGPATKQALDTALSGRTPAVPSATVPVVPSATVPAPGTTTASPAPGTTTPSAAAPATPSAAAPTTPSAAAPASAAAPTCATAHDSMNVVDHGLPGVREGAVNLNVYWCWDGSKITYVASPVVWTSITGDGSFLVWNTNPPATPDKDPQNGGYWTRETVVTGTFQECVIKYGCVSPLQPFKMDLYVFGDGVKFIANGADAN